MAPRKPVKWTPEKIAEIEALRAEGKSWRDISKHFGVTSSGGIFTIYHKYKPDGSWRPPAVWQLETTAPVGVAVLTYSSETEDIVVAKQFKDGDWSVYGDQTSLWNGWEPTHWMHLPHLPKGDA